MANGKKGDHPITDILNHNLEVFSPKIDNLIREIAKLVPNYRLRDMFDWFHLPALEEFEQQLQKKLEELNQEAKDSGWEVNE